MNCFDVDNSVVVSWYFDDEATAYTRAVLKELNTAEAFVPAIWPLEFSNVLLMAERRKRLKQADTTHILSITRSLPITVEQEEPGRLWAETLQLARAERLTIYDASYLDLAMRNGLPLATLDKALRRAARSVNVPLFTP